MRKASPRVSTGDRSWKGPLREGAPKTTGIDNPAETTFGAIIKKRRRDLGLTQSDLAARLRISRAHASYLEANRRGPSLALLVHTAEVLGLEPETLFLLTPHADRLIAKRLRTIALEKRGHAWKKFKANKSSLARHQVTAGELKFLRQVGILGKVAEPDHFLFILRTIRKAKEEE
jgi:transcriptional regulator with XRE-family HTH domain